jgi:hypothetical protein
LFIAISSILGNSGALNSAFNMLAFGKKAFCHVPFYATASPKSVMSAAKGIQNGNVRTLVIRSSRVSPYRVRNQAGGAYSPFMRAKMRARRALDQKPSLEMALAMPLSAQEMDNSSLATVGAIGNHAAREEILKRHIMSVDKISYDRACETFQEIENKNRQGMIFLSLPYQIGIAMGVTAAFASIPLVFDLPTAEWFNEHFVTTDVPEPKDLETMLEVGSWTWNWMEPPLGQISFFLLCLQYSRAQLDNLGIKPYTSKIKRMRGERLATAFPQYDPRILIGYSESAKVFLA